MIYRAVGMVVLVSGLYGFGYGLPSSSSIRLAFAFFVLSEMLIFSLQQERMWRALYHGARGHQAVQEEQRVVGLSEQERERWTNELSQLQEDLDSLTLIPHKQE